MNWLPILQLQGSETFDCECLLSSEHWGETAMPVSGMSYSKQSHKGQKRGTMCLVKEPVIWEVLSSHSCVNGMHQGIVTSELKDL